MKLKRSTISISILSAILLSACGGSSSSDNQAVEPTTPSNPTTPSTPTTPSNPDKPTVSTGGNPAPEVVHGGNTNTSNTPNSNPIGSGVAPNPSGEPTMLPGDKNEDKGDGNKGKGDGKEKDDGIKTPELPDTAGKTKEELEKLSKDAIYKAELADGHAKTAGSSITNLQTKIGGAGGTLTSAAALIAATPSIENIQNFEKAKRELEDKIEQYKKVSKDFVVQSSNYLVFASEANIYKAQADLKDASEKEPAAVVEYLQENEKAAKAAFLDIKYAELYASLISEDSILEQEIKALESLNEAYEKIVAADNKKIPDQLKEEARAAIESNKEKIAKLTEEKEAKVDALVDAEVKAASIERKLELLGEKLTQAKEAAAHRGVYGDTKNVSFLEVSKVDHDSNVDDNYDWVLHLKDGKEIKINTAASSSDTATYIGNSSNAGTWGHIVKVGDKSAAVKNLLTEKGSHAVFGRIGDEFFAVGHVADSASVKLVTGEFKGGGSAILKDSNGSSLIAKVTATITDKKLSGAFTEFKSYNATAANTATSVTSGPLLETSIPNGIPYQAIIDGNKFKPDPAQDQEKNASVYGYFYGSDPDFDNGGPLANDVKGIGGLVKHKDFEGAFGVKKD